MDDTSMSNSAPNLAISGGAVSCVTSRSRYRLESAAIRSIGTPVVSCRKRRTRLYNVCPIESPAQRLNGLTTPDAIGATLSVAEFGVRSDAEQVENRRGKVFGSVGVGDRHAAVAIGLTDDLAGANAAPGKETREDIAPVMPAGREDFAGRIAAAG